MPLVKKNKEAVKECVENNTTIVEQKKNVTLDNGQTVKANFARDGLHDETVDGATTIPLTPQEKTELDKTTNKIQTQANKGLLDATKHQVQTYGFQMPTAEIYVDGQKENAELCKAKIACCVTEHAWYAFYTKLVDGMSTGESKVRVFDMDKIQSRVDVSTKHSYKFLAEQHGYGTLDVATNLAVLGLADSIMLCDNSYSMREDDPSDHGDTRMSRWNYLKLVGSNDAFVTSMYDDDGFVLEFLTADPKLQNICENRMVNGVNKFVLVDPSNPDRYAILNDDFSGFTGVTSQQQVERIFTVSSPDFGTPTGTAIRRIYNRYVKTQAQNGTLVKPVVVKLYTDGKPNDGLNVKTVIRDIKAELSKTIYGSHAMLFQIVQTGKVKEVNDWFEELDKDTDSTITPDPGVGDIIDCVSDYEIELKQVLEKNPSAEWFNPGFYAVKCRVGVMIKALDASDEINVSSTVSSVFSRLGLY